MATAINMIGKTCGCLIVVERLGANKHGHVIWSCHCRCGKTTTACTSELRNGHVKSCGCLRKAIGDTNRRHNMSATPEYDAWKHMLARCNNPNNKDFAHYGGRGIAVAYPTFEAFYADIGPRPASGYTVDRIDVNGNYTWNNCRWATRRTQGNNTRRTFNITFNGRTQSITEWAHEIGINRDTLRNRIKNYGWSVQRAMTEPTKARGRL